MTDNDAGGDWERAEPGLSPEDAAARLAADGPNELPSQARFAWGARLLAPFREPAYQLLVAAGLVYLALGDALEGALLFAAAVMAVAIAIVQDYRTERTLSRLKDLSSPRALVRRGGQEMRIPARELVVGDIVLLQEGDRAPADGTLIAANGLAADESLMTGESAPVDKHVGPHDGPPEHGLTAPDFALGGSVIVTGEGAMRVTATGAQSRLGRIDVAVAGSGFEPPRLTVQLRRVVRLFAAFSILASLVLFVGAGLSGHDWIWALLLALALAISLVPEEIPLVTAVFTVVGAMRIARAGVLARQASAIETLGETTVLCVDKTGTLTVNRMAMAGAWTPSGGFLAADDAAIREGDAPALLRTARAACATVSRDPMELAICRAAPAADGPAQRLERSWPFTRDTMAMANLHREPDGARLSVKGAPERVIAWTAPDAAAAETALAAARDMAARGMRVIAVAEGREAPPEGAALTGAGARLVGLVGLADPLRPEAPDLISECAGAGVRVVMMTGDHAVTAAAIAAEAGLANADRVVEGAAFAALDDEARAQACRETSVFARVAPEQKLAIVEALKAAGEVVAMTGDGVNDAPALKAAHIGVAMGGRGSDVAREAAALVLVHDDLASLVRTLRLGRRIADNIRKALAYIFSLHAMIAGAALVPVLAGAPPLLLPLHVVILEFVIDPVCAVVLEADKAEPDVMRRPPRPPHQPLFGAGDIAANLALGLAALGGVLAAYWLAGAGAAPETARSTAFLTIMAMNAGLILITRIQHGRIGAALHGGNPLLWPAIAAVAAIGALATFIPPVAEVLDFAPPRLDVAAMCALGAGIAALGVEIVLRLGGARRPRPGR